MVVAASLIGARTDTGYVRQYLFYSRREHSLEMGALLFPGDDADLDVPEAAFLQELV